MIRRIRLISGLLIASFVVPHLINHALGLVSLQLMEGMLNYFVEFWHQPVFTLLLYGALLTHFCLALWSLYCRSTLRMPLWEALQVLSGLCIPPLLFSHVIGTRISSELLGVDLSFRSTIGILWTIDYGVLRQTLLLLMVWLHLLFGLHYWQRLRRGYAAWLPLWQLLAALLPILALLGFYRIGFELGEVDMAVIVGELSERYPQTFLLLQNLNKLLPLLYAGLLALVLTARYLRRIYRLKTGAMLIEHPLAGKITASRGQTLLEALRRADVAHSSICGGRARCTTCRVRITHGAEQLKAPDVAEQKALQGINVQSESHVRLACQLRLENDITMVPLIPPELGLQYVRKPGGVEGQEQQVTVLFIDLRGSTALAEQRLPYDVVFILNQFFAELAEALHQTNGHYAQFNGDGLMALYGLDSDFTSGCRQAIAGAKEMLRRLQQLNQRLGSELQEPLRVGIGIHCGEAIVGTMGPPRGTDTLRHR